MDFGDPIIYECPSCKKTLKKTTYRSYRVGYRSIYSDGYDSGYPPRLDIDLAKCPHCADVFFLHNLKGKTISIFEVSADTKDVEELGFEDLLKADDDKIAKTNEDQYQLSFDLWRALNRKYLYVEGGKLPAKIQARYKRNCKTLLKLVKEKLSETMILQENIPDEYFSYEEKALYDRDDNFGEEESLKMIAAELCRNLELYDECILYLKQLPQQYSWKKLVLADHAKKKDSKTFEMRRSDWYRLRPRNGDTWKTWECGAEKSDSVIAVIEKKSLSFYGEGVMKDYAPLLDIECSDAPWSSQNNFENINYVSFSNDITRIGDYAFYGSSFTFFPSDDSYLESIGKYAFSNTKISQAQIPFCVNDIEEGAFANCTKLKELQFKRLLEHIGDKSFFHCVHLSKLDIPEGVTSIGKEAFASCDEVTEIIIGENVQTIGDNAFAKSKKIRKDEFILKSVTNKNSHPQMVNESLFKNTDLSKVVLTVPEESLEEYKTATVWKDFGKIKTFKKVVSDDTNYMSLLNESGSQSLPSRRSKRDKPRSVEDYLAMFDAPVSDGEAVLPPPPQRKLKRQKGQQKKKTESSDDE